MQSLYHRRLDPPIKATFGAEEVALLFNVSAGFTATGGAYGGTLGEGRHATSLLP